MLALKALLFIVFVFGLYYGSYRLLKAFDRRCDALFGYRVLTIKKIVAMGFACVLLYAGYSWTNAGTAFGGDSSNGVVLMTSGACIAAWMALQNYRRTNLLFGTAATVVHVGLAPLAVQFGILIVAVAACVLVFIALPRPVYVVRV